MARRGERVLQQMTVHWHHTPDGWFPDHWTNDVFNRQGGVSISDEAEVRESAINPNLDDAEFALPRRSGMIVYDEDKDKNYVVQADGGLRDFEPGAAASSKLKWLYWLIPLGVIAVVLLIIKRRWKKVRWAVSQR
jgi:hypothetical protein